MSYINTATSEYPLSANDVKAEFPNTSFPSDAAGFEVAIARSGYLLVQSVPAPEVDYTQNVTEGKPESVGGTWRQSWIVSDANAEEIAERIRANADYLTFWDALMVSTVYASIREQSFTSLPMNTLATEFIALIGDAKAGRANEAAIQASVDAILSVGTFTEAQLAELGAALATGNLDGIYTL
jgi:hypothetical protein